MVKKEIYNNWILKNIPLVIGVLTFIVYIRGLKNGFVFWDDQIYVYENIHIKSLDLKLLWWVFQPGANPTWHPLTLLSHALDYWIWQLDPFGHHLTNIIFHTLNTSLVAIIVTNLTRTKIQQNPGNQIESRSIVIGLFTALLFGIHPLHVESVAWIAERKDVLCTFFFLITIHCYIKYSTLYGLRYYLLSIFTFILSLMSKPLAVTLPIVLIILDYYPLERLTLTPKGIRRAFIEKLPFLLFSALSSFITIWVQHSGRNIISLDSAPILIRVVVGMQSYIFYLTKTVFPFNLAPFYPFSVKVNPVSFDYIFLILLFLSFFIIAICSIKKYKLLTACWFYYVITLLPMIGLVKVSANGPADRYMYVPGIGPFILISAAIYYIYTRLTKKNSRIIFCFSLSIIFGFMVIKTIIQIGYWSDPIKLWTHEIKIFPDSVHEAYNNRGTAYNKIGEYEKALNDLNKSVKINPSYYPAYNNRGISLGRLKRYKDAVRDFSYAIKIHPENVSPYENRAIVFSTLGLYQEAIKDFNTIIAISPNNKSIYYNRGILNNQLKRYADAIDDFSMVIQQYDSKNVAAYNYRGNIYRVLGKYSNAIKDLNTALKINPRYKEAYYNLGLCYFELNDLKKSSYYYQEAARLGVKKAQERLSEIKRLTSSRP